MRTVTIRITIEDISLEDMVEIQHAIEDMFESYEGVEIATSTSTRTERRPVTSGE